MRAGALVLICCACAPNDGALPASAPATAPLAMPSPSPQRGIAAVEANERCVACHGDVAEEWKGSLHARAYVEPSYQVALAIEPLPFCRSCHAPEGDPNPPVPEPIASLGVGCVSCHVSGERILAAPREDSAERAPHPVVRDARFGAADACASCHEFLFPDMGLRRKPLLMQATVSEHRRSAHAADSCASCHMPASGTRRSHSFAASRSEQVVRSAASITATRLDDRRVKIVLTPGKIGHAFPTGDLFRRIEISAEAIAPEWSRSSGAERYLARHFVSEPRGASALRQPSHDDRVGADGPTPREVVLDVGSAGQGRKIAWRVTYQRVAHPLAIGTDEAAVDAEIVLGSGILKDD